MAFNFQGGPSISMGMPQGQPNMMPGGLGMMGPMPGMMPGFQVPLPGMSHDQQTMVNPGLNDAPLEFNTNKNKPPMPISGGDLDERMVGNQFPLEAGEMGSRNDRDQRGRDSRSERRGDRRKEMNSRHKDHNSERSRSRGRASRELEKELNEPGVSNSSDDMPVNSGSSGSDMGPNNVWTSGMIPGMQYPMMGSINPMIMDPNMMMPPFGMMGGIGIGQEGGMVAPENMMVKEVIQLKSVTLIPPPPTTPMPITRERPPGCKTIFVGGLAENTTEEIIREVFSRCGEMLTIRLSNKKFCHIRFLLEQSVDAALYFSGYRMRIENKMDAPNTGRIHVDFAQARDDQYEWECKQRQLQREQRHRDRVEKERLRVPSPPPVPHYTEHEATSVSEKIKVEESFGKAVQVVITWLERGDCNKRNASTFYSMIQSTNSHIRRLLTEKATHEEELQRARDLMKARMQSLLLQYAQIERVFAAASHKKVWDHFTKAQRKNIEMWKKQADEIKAIELEEHLNSGGDDEMDLSDEDDGMKKKPRFDDRIHVIKEENDSLRCQLEAYKNEVDLVRAELKAELDATEAKLAASMKNVQALTQQLTDSIMMGNCERTRVMELEKRLEKVQSSALSKENGCKDDGSAEKSSPPPLPVAAPPPLPPLPGKLVESDAKLIGLISMFLHVHPFGAGVDYIWSYLQKIEPGLRPADIEALLAQFPSLFQQELSGIGANMERKWVISVFKPRDSS
uniref:RRM domain-containing protein n=3 Tax=Lygus hesperus TaxID=30085 RepID=A0A0K8S492_LYGHE